MDYQDAGNPKPGATVLAQANAGHGVMPLLVTQNYGRGRTAVLATSGTWRWQMSSAVGDTAHDLFWQQLLRWISAESPGPVVATMASPTLEDDGAVRLSATITDKQFLAAPDASVIAHVSDPAGAVTEVRMTPVVDSPGTYYGEWMAAKPGAYLADVTAARGAEELGRDVIAFERQDGLAENFHTQQNRELLERLSVDTGGRYWQSSELNRLPKEISYSEAGISVRDTKELWNMPFVFVVLIGLGAGEWLLRRKWGVI